MQEQRFLLTYISKLKAFNIPAEAQKTMTVTASEFFCNFPEMGRENAERELNKAVDRLWDRTIFVKEENVKREVRWLQERATYISGEGKIEITFADTVLSYLTMLQGSFTNILLRNVSSLTNSYNIRLYELFIQRFDFQTRYISLNKIS
ncbi:RepB family plasmid replication initiator protein [Photorhabdus sp. SF281]|uniref:RepB family plasmid replication initiator protein n=1 Tax=Photorhabdus sp. SF281 TaxID=3459527 RepID=UPI004043FCF7